MAPWCARKLREIVERLESLLAIELLAASIGLGHLRPLRSSRALEALADGVGRTVRVPEGDFPPGPLIERLAEAVREGAVARWCAAGGLRLR
jgi:histidine ammonia-lyase